MIEKITRLLHSVVSIGTAPESDDLHNNRIRFINSITLLTIATGIVSFFFHLFLGFFQTVFANLLLLFVLSIPYWLNKLGKPRSAAISLFGILLICIFGASLAYGKESLLHVGLLLNIFVALAICEKKQHKGFIIYALITIVAFLFIEYSGVSLIKKNESWTQVQMIRSLALTSIFITIVILIRGITYFIYRIEYKRINEHVASQLMYSDLVNSVDGIVWEADATTFMFTFVSKQSERILGYPSEQWVKEPTFWQTHVHPDDVIWVIDYCRKMTSQMANHYIEYRFVAKDNRIVWLKDIITVVSELGKPEKLRGVMIDVSERKHSELRMAANYQNILELNRLRSDFVSMVSHQFRTPLATIKSSVQIVGLHCKSCAGQHRNDCLKHTQYIDAETNRIIDLIENVLAFNRIEVGSQIFNPSSTDIENLIHSVINQRFNFALKENKILYESIGVKHLASIDSVLFRQVIVNLLSNATKYSENKITITTNYQQAKLQVKIADQGIGIPVEEQKKLFQPFFRAKNVAHLQGIGLGLVIAKEIVDLHHGIIEIKSEQNIGTEIIIEIPYNCD